VRSADPDGYADTLTERALKHKKAKRYGQAFALLTQLDQAGLLADDARYAALVCGLQATTSKTELARVARTTSPVLKHAVALLDAGFGLARRLTREPGLLPEDLFFVGFNFCESTNEDERDFGATLLAHLADKSPRSKLGRSAKNKLRLQKRD
jgi:hypothetical protein